VIFQRPLAPGRDQADLILRRKHAEAEGWLGEIEGIHLTLTFLRDKRAEAPRFGSESRSTSACQPSAPGTDHDTNTSGPPPTSNPETCRPDWPVTPMAGTAAIGAVVHLPATAIEEGRDLSSMSGILADNSCRLLPA
jgi:hypothetical protein